MSVRTAGFQTAGPCAEAAFQRDENPRLEIETHLNLKIIVRPLLALLVSVLLLEAGLRLLFPGSAFRAGRELTHFGRRDVPPGTFVPDFDMGFRPGLGTDAYNAWGTLTNAYSFEKPPGVRRWLFLGDSVTARGRLIEGLRRLYGEEGMEYWNAGVESFNTVQEVAYYLKYNALLKPDGIVLTFHLNDFETVPVAYRARDGRLKVYAPNFPAAEFSPWLFAHSFLYRWVLGLSRFSERHLDAIVRETEEALATLRRVTAQDGISLKVVVFPILKPFDQWSPGDQLSRAQVLEILRRNNIPHVDLLPALNDAIRRGIPLCESAGDVWHPSPEAAAFFARYLFERGLLDHCPGAES